MRSRLAPALALLVLASCAAAGGDREEPTTPEGAGSAQTETLPEEMGTFERDASGAGFVVIATTRYALVGERVAELEHGKRYKMTLAPAPGIVSGYSVKRLVEHRRVLALVGTLADDTVDPGVVHLRSANAKDYALVGPAVGEWRDVRAALPTHDYASTPFRVSAVLERGSADRWEWLEYSALPLFRCAQETAPQTHLDLVSVQPDDSLLDGNIATDLGRESRAGAHAECRREGGAYACSLDDFGGAWGNASFSPAASFELVVERTDTTHTKVTFRCETLDRASLAAQSEDAP